MKSSSSPSDRLAEQVQNLGTQIRGAEIAKALATTREIEQCALQVERPLLLGAMICMQQRLAQLQGGAVAKGEFSALAEAWLKHGPVLLTSADDPAVDQAWGALQPHFGGGDENDLGMLPGSAEILGGDLGAQEATDASAFLESLEFDSVQQPSVQPAVTQPSDDATAFLESVETATPAREPKPVPAPIAPVAPASSSGAGDEAEEPVLPEIMEAFAQETREAFEHMEQSIMVWEKSDHEMDELRDVYRLAHSVKGAANSVGLRAVGTVLHRLEDMLEDLVEGHGRVEAHALSALVLHLIDNLRTALASGQTASPAWKGTADQLIAKIVEVRATVVFGASAAVTQPVAQSKPQEIAKVSPPPASTAASSKAESGAAAQGRQDHSTIRVETSHLDALMNLVGDLLINRHRLNRKLQQVTALRSELVRARERLLHVVGDFNSHHEFSQRRQTAVSQMSNDGFSELELDRYDDFNILSRSLVEIAADAEEIVTQIDGHFGSFSEEAVQFTNVTRKLQEDVARTRMVPLDQLFRRLQRAVRDACTSEGKNVAFVTEGAENRIDKFISDQLFRPLLHVVRNAVSHGIESADKRLAAGKSAEGRLTVRSRTEAGRLTLEILDDGGGLNRDGILRVARARGLLKETAALDDIQLAELIFQPGFSTATTTTDVSGRGVGLDVVRQEVTNLGGTVTVHNRPGEGCSFVLTLPVTLAINQVMFVQCSDRIYALPINFVERVVAAPATAFSQSGNSEMLMLDHDQTVPVVRLHSRLALAEKNRASTAVILTLAERRTALIVDRIQSKIDIVVKPLGPLLKRHPYFSGATLAGDGRVIFILDVPSLLAPGATRTKQLAVAGETEADLEVADGSKRVLVVDDSLSIRRIAASYLTQAGLEVETAVDGSDALEKLRTGDFGLVVSDLEMPRVNGFELLSEMRRHSDLEQIPVIILTSRDAAKHRDRARELGAADYLIKPVSREQLTSAVSALLARADAAA